MGQVENPTLVTNPGLQEARLDARPRLKDEDLSKLIPQRLYEVASDPDSIEAVKLEVLLHESRKEGDGFEPSLSMLVVERGVLQFPSVVQEDANDLASKVLNTRRLRALEQGLVGMRDRVVFSIIADDHYNAKGLEVISWSMSNDYRRMDLDCQFYDHFEAYLKDSGFKYLFDHSDPEDLNFFLRRGRYRGDQLDLDKQKVRLMVPKLIAQTEYTTIVFFDPNMEIDSVKPEFLKSA